MRRVHPAPAAPRRGYPRLAAGFRVLLGAVPLALAAPALGDVTPPPGTAQGGVRVGARSDPKLRAQPGPWLLDDELRTRAAPVDPARLIVPQIQGAMVTVASPPPPALVAVRVPLLPFVGEKRDRAEVQGTDSVLDFVDDTIDAGDLVSRIAGRTVVKRVQPAARRER